MMADQSPLHLPGETLHLLPTHLAPLADLADKRSTGSRFALTGIHLRVHGDNTFLAEATDTKVLLRVSGPCVAPVDEYPEHPGLKDAPNGSMEALIPATTWTKVFSSAAKTTKRAYGDALKSVAVKMSKEMASFGSTNLDSYPVEQTKLVEGRFPPAADIIDQTRKRLTRSLWVDPIQLSRALKVIGTIGCDEDSQAVELCFTDDPERPFLIESKRSDGMKSELIVMPLAERPTIKPEQQKQPDAVAEVVRLGKELEIVREQVEKLKKELENADNELAKAWHEIDTQKDKAKDLLRNNDALREQLKTAVKVECDRPMIQPIQATQRVSILSRRERLQRLAS
jgi:hypothetical protein